MADLCPHCGAKLPAIRDAFCCECRGDLGEAPLEPKPYSGREPVSEAPSALAAGLWHTTEERLFQWVKLSWYDDQGSIDATAQGFLFRGRKGRWEMTHITDVDLIGPVIPWASLAGLAIGSLMVLLMAKVGLFNYLTLENPITYLMLAGMDMFVVASCPMKWGAGRVS
jgi:hypothetical protein